MSRNSSQLATKSSCDEVIQAQLDGKRYIRLLPPGGRKPVYPGDFSAICFRNSGVGRLATPQFSKATSWIITKVKSGGLFSTSTSRSVVP